MTRRNPHDWMITLHWTAGGHRASDDDLQHYHFVIEADGNIVKGRHKIEDQVSTQDGTYAAHVLNCNVRNIGVALAGMYDATEEPLSVGPSPITEKQISVAAVLIARLAGDYGVPVTPDRILTHAEVQPNLGIQQKGKWDIAMLPWNPDIRGARAVGDWVRMKVREAQGQIGMRVSLMSDTPATVQIGSQGPDVRTLQSDLARLRYFTGRIDGDFGPRTRQAVMGFQANNGLMTDGIVGPVTWSALRTAEPQARRDVTMEDLRDPADGPPSRIIRAGDMTQSAAAIGAATTVLTAIKDATDQAAGILPTLHALVVDYWPLLLTAGLCVAVMIYAQQAKRARLDDERTGRTIG